MLDHQRLMDICLLHRLHYQFFGQDVVGLFLFYSFIFFSMTYSVMAELNAFELPSGGATRTTSVPASSKALDRTALRGPLKKASSRTVMSSATLEKLGLFNSLMLINVFEMKGG